MSQPNSTLSPIITNLHSQREKLIDRKRAMLGDITHCQDIIEELLQIPIQVFIILGEEVKDLSIEERQAVGKILIQDLQNIVDRRKKFQLSQEQSIHQLVDVIHKHTKKRDTSSNIIHFPLQERALALIPIEQRIGENKIALLGGDISLYTSEWLEIFAEMEEGKIEAFADIFTTRNYTTQELLLYLKTDLKTILRFRNMEKRKPLQPGEKREEVVQRLRDAIYRNGCHFLENKRGEKQRLYDKICEITDEADLEIIATWNFKKVAIFYELFGDIETEHLEIIHSLDTETTMDCELRDSLTPEYILLLKKNTLRAKARRTYEKTRKKIGDLLHLTQEKTASLSKETWDHIRQKFSLKIHKHTLENILHYIQTGIAQIDLNVSGNFTKALKKLIEEGTLAKIIQDLGVTLSEVWKRNSKKHAEALASQIKS